MASIALEEPMTDDKPKTLSVKLRYRAVELARIVAAYRNEQITEMLSDILEPVLEEMHAKEIARHSAAESPKRKKRREKEVGE